MPHAKTPDHPKVKMTIRVYTVTRTGIITPPRATVTVPYGYEPALQPCPCPTCRAGGHQ